MAGRRRAVNTAAQGRSLEVAVRRLFEQRGWAATMRSAASKGAVDVVAIPDYTIHHPLMRLVLVQCKLTNPRIPPAERITLMNLALRACAIPLIAHRVDRIDALNYSVVATRVQYDESHAMWVGFRELTGPGPKDWRTWIPPEIGGDDE